MSMRQAYAPGICARHMRRGDALRLCPYGRRLLTENASRLSNYLTLSNARRGAAR
jgi:hypothetical protein